MIKLIRYSLFCSAALAVFTVLALACQILIEMWRSSRIATGYCALALPAAVLVIWRHVVIEHKRRQARRDRLAARLAE